MKKGKTQEEMMRRFDQRKKEKAEKASGFVPVITVESYKRLKEQGLSDLKIGTHYGIDNNAIQKFKRENGLIKSRTVPAEPEIEKAATGAEEQEAPLPGPVSTIKDQILQTIAEQIDAQTVKGVGKYTHNLDDCPPEKFNWQQMINEELIDALQYQQKEIRRLSQSSEDLTLLDYQNLSKRTLPEAKASLSDLKLAVSNYAMGLAGEAGEVVDLLKKHLHHGHKLDKQALIGELGDVMHYVAGLCSLLDVELEVVGTYNIEKLKRRYPDGFSEQASVNRAE